MSRHYRKREAGLKEADYAMTLTEIGRELGVTCERSRQLEARALRKAKGILKRWGYTLQDLLPDGEHHD